MVPWKTLGIYPHGKYYRSLPWSPWADNTANKHLYRMCVSSLTVPIKSYKLHMMAAFYYDPLGPAEPPRWRRSDIFLDDTAYYIRAGQVPLPPAKKEYRYSKFWVDPHPTIFHASDPFIWGGSKKGKIEGSIKLALQLRVQ